MLNINQLATSIVAGLLVLYIGKKWKDLGDFGDVDASPVSGLADTDASTETMV